MDGSDAASIGRALRERLQHLGEPWLSDADCIALISGTVGRGASAVRAAEHLLQRFGGLSGLASRSPRELVGPGMGPAGAASLVAAFGLVRRLGAERLRPRLLLQDGAEVARIVRDMTRGARRERVYVALLDVRCRALGIRHVSTGSVDSAPVHPREVFGPAVREAASSVLVAHNHPSGDPTPSADDWAVTDRLRRAGDLLGLTVLDHVVVGLDRYYSFAEEGYFSYLDAGEGALGCARRSSELACSPPTT